MNDDVRTDLPPDAKQRLLDWFADEGRDLPWRHTRDPYRILVSEIMLQQTQAERVVPKYHEFLRRFPTLESLADAPASEVIRAWAGLGYNRRALNLQRACRAVVEQHDGVIPRDPAALAALPGIGAYTAGAVACFAYEQDVGFADTNIRRVVHRVLAGPEIPSPRMTTREVERAAARLVPSGSGWAWNQAIMELGARICRARSTDCERCPLEQVCRARPAIQQLLAVSPPPAKKPSPRFETTSRYFRGRIVDALRDAGPDGLSVHDLGLRLNPLFANDDPAFVMGHIEGLVRDGLVTPVGSDGMMREDAPAYDAGAPDPNQRFRLPD